MPAMPPPKTRYPPGPLVGTEGVGGISWSVLRGSEAEMGLVPYRGVAPTVPRENTGFCADEIYNKPTQAEELRLRSKFGRSTQAEELRLRSKSLRMIIILIPRQALLPLY